MKTLFAKLAAAAVALTAAHATFAFEPPAHPHPGVHVTAAARVVLPVPVVRVALPVPVVRVVQPVPVVRVEDRGPQRWERSDGGRWERDRRDHEGWRRESWRAEERARIRAEYARLDDVRADFYARPHRRWDVRRFERWYVNARAELDVRWDRVSFVAMR